MKHITYEAYLDKTLGCWLGKSIGGTIGAPYEGHKIFGVIDEETCWPSIIYPNDDLDIQVVWLEMLEETGPFFTRQDMAAIWQERCWYNFAEYGFFLYNQQRGIHAPLSGRFNNVFFCECEGCPIRAEIWGCAAPGHPQLAAQMARWDGELDHIDISVWAEQFWAAAVAEAFVADSLVQALQAGRLAVPQGCLIDKLCDEVPALWEQYSHDLPRTWRELVYRYGHRDGSKAEINFCFSLLPLYVGEGDFKKTIVTAVTLGWDTDCTAATAGALLGTLQGARALPADWAKLMGENLACDCNVRHKTATLQRFAEDTCKAGLEMLACRGENPQIIRAVPQDVQAQVEALMASRAPISPIEISVQYHGEPVLARGETAKADLVIRYSGTQPLPAALTLDAADDLMVSPASLSLTLLPGEQSVRLSVAHRESAQILWDKNLVEALLTSEDGDLLATHTFGLAGARQWMVYGPYFDAWDKDRWAVCPFRNAEKAANPCTVEGCSYACSHVFAKRAHAYLDEKALLQGELPDEYPHLAQEGKDYLENERLCGYVGEAVFYLTREIAAQQPCQGYLNLGATGPFTLWIDGKEVLSSDAHQGWTYQEHQILVDMDQKPKRIVLKCVREGDHYQTSLLFIKTDVPGDRTVGHSYIMDCMGDRIR